MSELTCAICLECIESESVNNCKKEYSLPECNHAFHTECIIHWFRQGNSSECPCCKNPGEEPQHNYSNRDSDLSHVFRLSKGKDAPVELVKAVNKYKKIQDTLKALRFKMKTLRLSEGVFMKINSDITKTRSKIWENEIRSKNCRCTLSKMYPTRSVIIVTRKSI